MNVPELIVETLPVGHLQCNCTILGDPVSRKAIVVDPGGDAEMLIERLVELDLQVERIIHTHAHLDHFLASGKMKEETGAKLALHREDLFLWDMLEDQCRMFGIHFEPTPPPDQWLENEEARRIKNENRRIAKEIEKQEQNKHDQELRLLETICIQHEIDHLNGMTIHDRQMITTIVNEQKFGRNEIVMITDGKETKDLKWKKAKPLIDSGEWELYVGGPIT